MTAKQKRLIDAVNILCEEVSKSLPIGWDIVLTMNSQEASMTLIDPDGEEVEFHGTSPTYSSLSAACDAAREI